MIIQLAIARDEPVVRDCAEQAYAGYIPLIGQKPAPMLADYAALIAAGMVYVAKDQHCVFQGFIVFYSEEEHMMLENVAVLPRAAGQGIGKALIGFCEDAARKRGLKTVRLYTNEKMIANLLIYPKLGYAEVARRIENGFHRVYFEKSLTGPHHWR